MNNSYKTQWDTKDTKLRVSARDALQAQRPDIFYQQRKYLERVRTVTKASQIKKTDKKKITEEQTLFLLAAAIVVYLKSLWEKTESRRKQRI